jgi:hypothetical protein
MAEDLRGATEGLPAVPVDGSFPLLIAVAAAPDERVRLAERVDGIAPLLLVSGLDELRRLITPAAQRRASPPAESAPAAVRKPSGPVLTIDATRSVARWRDDEVRLTRLELGLLTCLNSEPLRAWTFAELHRTVWRSAGRADTADVQSLVKRLRQKLARLGTSVTVDAVRGTGFRLSDHQRPTIRA